MDWYYMDGDERRGPISDIEVGQLHAGGKIADATLVWREGWSEWRRYGEREATAAAAGTATCVECHKVFPTAEMIQYEGSWICPTCKPVFFQKVREGVAITSGMTYGGFWIRFAAKFIDGIILQVINFGVRAVTLGVAAPTDPNMQMRFVFLNLGLSMSLAACYAIFFVGKFGATPGKMALRLRVVRSSGAPVGYARACGRYFAEILSSLILGIGYIMAAFDDEKRTLHDRICDTRVIRLNA